MGFLFKPDLKKPTPDAPRYAVHTNRRPHKGLPDSPGFFRGFFARPSLGRFVPAARFSMEILLITNLLPFYHILPIRAGVFSPRPLPPSVSALSGAPPA